MQPVAQLSQKTTSPSGTVRRLHSQCPAVRTHVHFTEAAEGGLLEKEAAASGVRQVVAMEAKATSKTGMMRRSSASSDGRASEADEIPPRGGSLRSCTGPGRAASPIQPQDNHFLD